MSEDTSDGNDSVARGGGGVAVSGNDSVFTAKLLTAIDGDITPEGATGIGGKKFLNVLDRNISVMNGSSTILSTSNSIILLTIYEKCFEIYEGVAEICIKVKTNEVCAEAKLLSLKLAEGCVGYDVQGNLGKAKLDFGTINTGIWKLESIVIQVKQNFDTGDGRVTFSGKLYQLTIQGYRKRREWNDEELSRW